MFLSGYIFQYMLIAPRVLLLVVLAFLVRRRLYRQFPFFFAYVVQEVVQSVVMIALVESPKVTGDQYTIAYSIAFAVRTAFSLGILYEIFIHMFSNYAIVERWGKIVFSWAAVVLLMGGLGLAVYTGSYGPRLIFVTQLLNRTASILQCGLLCALFIFASHLRLSWKSHIFGIALGAGILASTDLAASAIRSHTGLTYILPLDYLVMAAYHFSVLIWIFYLFAPERSYVPKAVPQHDLETWNLELERLLKQ
jgi:hypothetical protein